MHYIPYTPTVRESTPLVRVSQATISRVLNHSKLRMKSMARLLSLFLAERSHPFPTHHFQHAPTALIFGGRHVRLCEHRVMRLTTYSVGYGISLWPLQKLSERSLCCLVVILWICSLWKLAVSFRISYFCLVRVR